MPHFEAAKPSPVAPAAPRAPTVANGAADNNDRLSVLLSLLYERVNEIERRVATVGAKLNTLQRWLVFAAIASLGSAGLSLAHDIPALLAFLHPVAMGGF